MSSFPIKNGAIVCLLVFSFVCGYLPDIVEASSNPSKPQKIPSTIENKQDRSKSNYNEVLNTWKAQLGFAKTEGGWEGILHKNGLYLIEYELSSAYNYTLSTTDNSTKNKGVIVKDDRTIDNNFKIDYLPEKIVHLQHERKGRIIKDFVENNKDKSLAVVNLKWAYKGDTVYTKCIISKEFNTIVYDDFLSNITYVSCDGVKGIIQKTEYVNLNAELVLNNLDKLSDSERAAAKAAVYRFYKRVNIQNGVYVTDLETGKEINISQEFFSLLTKNLEEMNNYILQVRAKGEQIEVFQIDDAYLKNLLK